MTTAAKTKLDITSNRDFEKLYLQCAIDGNKAYVWPDGDFKVLHREDNSCPFPSENAFAITPEHWCEDDLYMEESEHWADALDNYFDDGDYQTLAAQLDEWRKPMEANAVIETARFLKSLGAEDRRTAIQQMLEDEKLRCSNG